MARDAPDPIDERLREARALLRTDPDRAAAALRALADHEPIGPTWAAAQLDLAELAAGHGRYDELASRAIAVLDACIFDSRRTSGLTELDRGVAAYWTAVAADYRDQPPRRDLLDEAIARIVDREPYLAGSAFTLRAAYARYDGDRAGARTDWLAAVAQYERSGSMLGSPGVRRSLARLELEEGQRAAARQHLDDALAWLAQFPSGGLQVRRLADAVRAQRAELETSTSER